MLKSWQWIMPRLLVLGIWGLVQGAQAADLVATAQAVEQKLSARVGLLVLDTATGQHWAYRSQERFPLNSTFKAFACAGVLHRVDSGQERLAQLVRFSRADLVDYSPVTEAQADGPGMSVAAVCAAALGLSDNTAGNLVLDRLGGPQGWTQFMRSLGDTTSQLDRREPALNEAIPGDLRDTTTPEAAALGLQKVLLGDVLQPQSRQQLIDWMQANQVAGPLFRSILPAGWRIADRTGSGDYGSRSIIAVIWPPERPPLVVALYLTQTQASAAARNAAIAEIGQALVATVR